MKELKGDIWDYHLISEDYRETQWIVISTNGFVKKNGECVMGRGVAYQAKTRYPHIPRLLGRQIGMLGNHVYAFWNERLITFPVKHNWWETADLALIEQSAQELVALADQSHKIAIVLPRVGCSNGKLDWKDVKPILEKYLDDRFTVVDLNG